LTCIEVLFFVVIDGDGCDGGGGVLVLNLNFDQHE